jgi:hypothetical protein
MSNMSLYIIGIVVLIAGLAWGAVRLGIPTVWIGIGAVIVLGIGLVSAVGNTRRRERPPSE